MAERSIDSQQLLTLLNEARDLLTEATHGNPARSPAHNGRLKVDAAIALLSGGPDRWAHPRWQRTSRPPAVGGHYVVGGYISGGILPRRFETAFATMILTLDGPSWSHCDPTKSHVPLEYWQHLGAHPEYAPPAEASA